MSMQKVKHFSKVKGKGFLKHFCKLGNVLSSAQHMAFYCIKSNSILILLLAFYLNKIFHFVIIILEIQVGNKKALHPSLWNSNLSV